jgi:hypothetical protein
MGNLAIKESSMIIQASSNQIRITESAGSPTYSQYALKKRFGRRSTG